MHLTFERSVCVLGAFVLLVAALFSEGYHHFDEHFQILEFAGYKLGYTPLESLPWEYHFRTRSTIQPSLAVVIHKSISWLGNDDPFRVAMVLRLLSGTLSFVSIYLFYLSYLAYTDDKTKRKWFLLSSFFLWASVYNNVRFSAENWSGSLFLIGYSLLFVGRSRSQWRYFPIGLLLGLSFLFRYQIVFSLVGLCLWLIMFKREDARGIVLLLVGACVSMCSGLFIDSWFYGEWTISVWNDFVQDLWLDKLSDFGTAPWWFYFKATFFRAVPPIGLVVLLSCFLFVLNRVKHPATWALVPFLVFHIVVGHKETRYLFPLLGLVPLLLAESGRIVQAFLSEHMIPNAYVWRGILVVCTINLFILGIVLFRPADPHISLYEALYRDYPDATTVLYIEKDPYRRVLNINYYKRDTLAIKEVQNAEEIELSDTRKTVFVTTKPQEVAGLEFQSRLIYRTLPEWVRKYNFNNWIERTRLWWAYELGPRQGT